MFQETTTWVELLHLPISWPPPPSSPFLLQTLSKTGSFVRLLWCSGWKLRIWFIFLWLLFSSWSEILSKHKGTELTQGSSLKHMKRHHLCLCKEGRRADESISVWTKLWYSFFHTVYPYGDDGRSSLTGKRRSPLKWLSPRQVLTWSLLLFL